MISIIILGIFAFICVLGLVGCVIGWKYFRLDDLFSLIFAICCISSIAWSFQEMIKRADVFEKTNLEKK